MANITINEWYRRVNAAWPADRPALTGHEAVRAAGKLYRFVLGVQFPGEIIETSGNRHTWVHGNKLYVNPGHGWKDVVHDLSHWLHYRYNPGVKPHSAEHARLELRCIKEVLKRGWLDGVLMPAEPPPVDPGEAKSRVRAKKYASILRRIETWESKRKRAENALKKLGKQMRYYEKQMQASSTIH